MVFATQILLDTFDAWSYFPFVSISFAVLDFVDARLKLLKKSKFFNKKRKAELRKIQSK